MFSQFKALIIHSHKEANDQIKAFLEDKGYLCNQVIQFKELEEYYENHSYDCIIIEDEFPRLKTNEFLVQTKLRGQPILIVIGDTLSSDYLESLLNAGADDYVTIPYKLKDIESKIQSVYKNGILKPRRIYRFKDIVVDTTARTCSCANKPLNLTKNEFKLLTILISHPYQPFSISYLFEEVWGSSIYEDGTSIPGLMSNLIMKLRLINNDQEYIKRFGKDSYKMAF
ncbi:response regulator transcription factor [Coprobacillus cateniformis]|uniref:response regulator transcription factor n=1 Tax=Coprobacillus cateniformis TaxID=100884 RepID=UPI0034A2DF79